MKNLNVKNKNQLLVLLTLTVFTVISCGPDSLRKTEDQGGSNYDPSQMVSLWDPSVNGGGYGSSVSQCSDVNQCTTQQLIQDIGILTKGTSVLVDGRMLGRSGGENPTVKRILFDLRSIFKTEIYLAEAIGLKVHTFEIVKSTPNFDSYERMQYNYGSSGAKGVIYIPQDISYQIMWEQLNNAFRR